MTKEEELLSKFLSTVPQDTPGVAFLRGALERNAAMGGMAATPMENPPLPQARPVNAPQPPLGQRPQIAPQLSPNQMPMPQPQIPMGPPALGMPSGMGRSMPLVGFGRNP